MAQDGWTCYARRGECCMPDDVRDFFSRHAAGYTASQSHARGQDLTMLTDLLHPELTDSLVDIAAGTGHTALHLRPLIARAVLVDLTPAMLAEAQNLADERGLEIETLVADAVQVPLTDESFTLATCRRAAHHFPDIPGFLSEAHRLLAPGGRLGIVDMTAPDAAIGLVNRIERLRDASHATALSPEQWSDAVKGAGFNVEALEIEREDYDLQRWLSPVMADEVDLPAVASLLRDAPAAEREALAVREEPDGPHFIKSRVVLIARRR